MDESGRHQELWRQLHREVIQGLEAELERLHMRESDVQQAAQERELVLLQLLEVERTSRLTAQAGAGTAASSDGQSGPGHLPGAASASARGAELLARLSLNDPRMPELQAALQACEEELARMRNRKAIRAIAALVSLKTRLLGRD